MAMDSSMNGIDGHPKETMSRFTQPEPIAIIGTACHFPGSIDSPSQLADFLRSPHDALRLIPSTRLGLSQFQNTDPNHHGSTNITKAYVLSKDLSEFDSNFFHLHASEAEATDPQHRLVLQTVYEALEAAGYPLSAVAGSRTGVYIGCMLADYPDMLSHDIDTMPKYSGIGSSRAMLSNRVSYFYDLQGPSITIDTACSSTMVAVDAAVRSLRDGTSELAIVAGANLILTPHFFVQGTKLGFLSPTSRCRMWDAAADGYARGEGVAAILLKPLRKALADGDDIESLIVATGVNSDGRTKSITMPSARAQADLIRSTYLSIGLDPDSSLDRPQFYEAHGTGTKTGDPLEAEGIAEAFFPKCRGHGMTNGTQMANKLYVGSIKTLLGHLETCAGLAGLLKASIAIQHGFVPENWHFDQLNPDVEPFCDNLHLATQRLPWPDTNGMPRRASVGSYGFGGTNAHVILESFAAPGHINGGHHPDESPETNGNCVFDDDVDSCAEDYEPLVGPFVFSAASKFSLCAGVRHFAEYVSERADVDWDNAAWTLMCRRTTLPFRVSIEAVTRHELLEALESCVETFKKTQSFDTFATEVETSEAWSDRRDAAKGRFNNNSSQLPLDEQPAILGIFTGQGAQWQGMARELLTSNHLFEASIRACDEVLHKQLPEAHRPAWSIRDELLKPPGASDSRLGEAEVASPVGTALQLALVDLLQASGVKFAAIVGHSSGEMAALYAAGFLRFEDALKIAYYKGFCGRHSKRKGAMLAAGMPYDRARAFCKQPQFEGRIEVAASNAPNSVTLAGDADTMACVKEALDDANVFARFLKVDRAHHSYHVSEVLPFLEDYLKSCNILVQCAQGPDEGGIAWVSSAYGNDWLYDGSQYEDKLLELKDYYWLNSARGAVLYSQAIECALSYGPFDMAIEIGPHAALKGPTSQTVTAALGSCFPYTGVLQRGKNAVQTFSSCLGRIWERLGPDMISLEGYQRTFKGHRRGGVQASMPRVVKGLPTYQWDFQKHWHESRAMRSLRLRDGPLPHELLGRRCPDDSRTVMRWRNILTLEEVPWLNDHSFQGTPVFPMAGYVSMAVESALRMVQGRTTTGQGRTMGLQDIAMLTIDGLTVHKALAVEDSSRVETMVTLTHRADHLRSLGAHDHTNGHMAQIVADFVCEACAIDDEAVEPALNTYCTARITVTIAEENSRQQDATKLRPDVPAGGLEFDTEPFYAQLQRLGLAYQGLFHAVKTLRRKEGSRKASAWACWQPNAAAEIGQHGLLHPAVFDNAMQTILAALYPPGSVRFQPAVLPVRLGHLAIDPQQLLALGEQCSTPAVEKTGVCTLTVATYRGQRHDPVASLVMGLPNSPLQALDAEDSRLSSLVQAKGAIWADEITFRAMGDSSHPSNDVSLFYKTVSRVDVLSPNFQFDPPRTDSPEYYDKISVLERVAMYYIRKFVARVSPQDQAAFPQWHHRHMTDVYRRLLEDVSQGCREPDLSRALVAAQWPEEDIDGLLRRCEQDGVIDARLVQAVGENLLGVCQGKREAIEVMLEEDGLLAATYDRGIGIVDANHAVGKLLAQIAHRYPSMHMLEVGAGSGGTTKYILDALDDLYASYTFTDITPGFFEKSEQKLARFDDGNRIGYQVLDIEKDPCTQGFQAGAYDVVIAANCVHATKSLAGTLANMRKLLRPGGFLVLLDISGQPIWLSYALIFGGLSQWWAGVEGDGRVDDPGATHDRWHQEMVSAGFSGLDQAVPFPRRRSMFSIMVSQAVDATVLALRQPLATSSVCAATNGLSLAGEHVVVVGSSSTAVATADRLGPALLSYNSVTITHIPSLEHSMFTSRHSGINSEQASSQSSVLLLTELEKPLFSDDLTCSCTALNAFKMLLKSSRRFLVVTRRCSDMNPHSNMLLGVIRALAVECPHVQFQTLDIDNSESSPSELISAHFMRMMLLSCSRAPNDQGRESSRKPHVLWSSEPESTERCGQLLVPRVIRDKTRNDRLNSTRREILQSTSRSSHRVQLEKRHLELQDSDGQDSSLVPVRRDMNPWAGQPLGGDRVRLETSISTLQSLTAGAGIAGHHIVLGTATSPDCLAGRKVLAMSPTPPASTLEICRHDIYELPRSPSQGSRSDIPDAVALRFVVSNILLRQLASLVPDGSKVLLVDAPSTLITMTTSDSACPRHLRDKVLHGHFEPGPARGHIVTASNARIPLRGDLRASLAQQRILACVVMSPRPSDRAFGDEADCTLSGRLGSYLPCYQYPAIPYANEGGLWPLCLAACADLTKLESSTGFEEDGVVTVNALSGLRITSDKEVKRETLTGSPTTLLNWEGEIFWTHVRPLDTDSLFHADKTYLLVGLSSDLGLSLCLWMVANGARNLAFASLHAPERLDADPEFLQAMHARGVQLKAVTCDASDQASLESALQAIASSMPCVGGVVHGAMMLEDKLFSDMTAEDLHLAILPKAAGARNLDQLLSRARQPLDFFVMVSSVGCIIGNISQSNYHAGNMFMAALACQRRAKGLPASILHLSAVAGVGYVHHQPERAKGLTSTFAPLHEEDLHIAFAEAIEAGRPASTDDVEVICSLARIPGSNRSENSTTATSWLGNPRFAALVREDARTANSSGDGAAGPTGGKQNSSSASDVGASLRAASGHAQVAEVIQAAFLKKAEMALRMSPGTLEPRTPLAAVGLDSVLAVEMRFWFLKTCQVEIPVLKIMERSVAQISEDAAREYNAGRKDQMTE